MEDGYGPGSHLPLLSVEELTAAVSGAHELGALVSAHITEAGFLQMVVDAGVNDAMHMPWDTMSEEMMRQMIEGQVYVTPTLTVMEV